MFSLERALRDLYFISFDGCIAEKLVGHICQVTLESFDYLIRNGWYLLAKTDHSVYARGVPDPVQYPAQNEAREKVIREKGLGDQSHASSGRSKKPQTGIENLQSRKLPQMGGCNVLMLGT